MTGIEAGERNPLQNIRFSVIMEVEIRSLVLLVTGDRLKTNKSVVSPYEQANHTHRQQIYNCFQ